MKKLLVIAFAAALFATAANAQDSTTSKPIQNQTITSSVSGARYEIVTSGIPDHKRYRIDKVDGTVWTFYSGYTYTDIKREATDQDVRVDDSINYQLILLGDGSNAYLLNLNTGAVWYYEWHLFKDDELKLMK